MKLRFILTIWLLIICFGAFSQSVSVQWLRNSDGSSWDLISDMVMDSANNIYVAGNYSGTAKKDMKSTQGDRDIFIAKYNSKGEQLWLQTFQSQNYCHIQSMELTPKGQLLLSGFFNKELQLGDFTLNAKRGNDAFFTVLDTSGNFKMVKHIQGYFKGNPIFVKAKKDKGYWVVGSYTNNLTIDEMTFDGNYSSEIFIGSFDDQGKLEQHLLLTGNANDMVNHVELSPNGNLWITGSFEENLTIVDQQIVSKGYTDAFLIGLTQDLTVLNVKQLGNHFKDYGQTIQFDSSGNIIWAGCFSDAAKVNEENILQSNGNYDVFLAKYNDAYQLLWAQQIGGKANDYVMSVASNKYNSIYISGSFRGSIEKEDQQIESVNFSSDVFLAKFGADGKFRYMEAFGDTNADYARQIRIDSDNYLYLSGNFNKKFKAIEDTTLNGDGEDFFLTRLYDCEFSKPVNLPNDTSLCGSQMEIIADSGYVEYRWNDKMGNRNHNADTSEMYYLVAMDRYKCISKDSIFVQLNRDPVANLGPDIVAYQGDIIYLTANPSMESYLWNDKTQLSVLEINTQKLSIGNHQYTVTLTDTNFCQGTDDITLTILARDGLQNTGEQKLSLNIFPNPAKEHCTVRLQNISTNKELKIACYGLEGALLWEITPNILTIDMDIELDIQNWVPGTYILMVKNGAASLDERFVVVK